MMTLVWIVVGALALYGVVAVCGKFLLQAVAMVAAIFSTPVKEYARLKKEGRTRRARWLLGSFITAIVMWSIVIALLIAMPK